MIFLDVNEHGHVHQTITVRTIQESEVAFSGGAETRDSWFPGFSWTIMNCGICHSHLGWKFNIVDVNTFVTEDRPRFFYGLSTSQVATVVPERTRAQGQSRGPFRVN